jgi:hypothetical protein
VNSWQIQIVESNADRDVSFRGGYIQLDREKMEYEKYFHGHTISPGWYSGDYEEWEVFRTGKFTYGADSLQVIFKVDQHDPDTGYITPAHWVHPVNLEDSVYMPEEIQNNFSFEYSFFWVYGNFIYEKEE